MKFPPGSVGETLTAMQGVWHDHIQLFHLNGDTLDEDPWSGTPGLAPFDNLVYVEFDGEHYRQTNVTFRGRPLYVRSFEGILQDGVLRFGHLGPNDPSHIGASAGPYRLIFAPIKVSNAWENYVEPDFIQMMGPGQRSRTTILYRNGLAVRTMHAAGYKLSPDPSRRVANDPRGLEGSVHEPIKATHVFDQH
ncbi:MAG: hypothetical protein NTX25_15015 [Proteobacteria bacterium]|nr:hypothetical protein [Pseudomonadota bacterium]